MVEFADVEGILKKFPPNGPDQLVGDPALVTDDTQMTLSLAEALIECFEKHNEVEPINLEEILRRHFVKWNNSPENNRAPGMTCLQACDNLEKGIRWQKATMKGSKGCGANMRVAPVALLSDRFLKSDNDRSG